MSDSGPRAAGRRTAAAVACLGLVAAAAGEYSPARQFVTQDFHGATRTASRRAGLVPEAGLPAPVRVRHAASRDGRVLRFYLNFSGEAQSFSYAHAAGTELLSQRPVATGQRLTLPPWDLAVIRE